MKTTRLAVLAVIALILTAAPSVHAQFTDSNQTNIISGVTSNWSGIYSVGYGASFDQLQIINLGVLSSDYGEVGFDSSHNSAIVSGNSSIWSNNVDLMIGEGIAASFNSLTITNGGAVHDSDGYVGRCELCGGGIVNSNSVIVTGTGSVWSNRGNVYLGSSGSRNSLTVSDGGTVYNQYFFLRGTNSSVVVSGNGATWWNQGSLYLGTWYWGGVVSNQITIEPGGSVIVGDHAYVGPDVVSTGSQINVAGGNLYVTNAAHNATLEISRGYVRLSAGLLQVDVLALTNADGRLIRSGGTLSVTSTNLSMTLDADADGLPNGWEQIHGFDVFDPMGNNGASGDPDGDGFSNLQEFYGGSDPNIGSSVPSINYWKVSGSGKWELGANWILGLPPVSNEAVFITNAITKTVTVDATTTNSASAMTISNLVVSGPSGTTNSLKLSNAGIVVPLVVGNTFTLGNGGVLLVTNAALVVNGGLIINSGTATLNADGLIVVTNATNNAVLEVRCGQFIQNDGTLQADILVITNACGRFNRTGGTLSVGSSMLSSNLDADGDGLPNGWEQAHTLDPLDSTGLSGPNGDPDGDGFVNLEEYQAGTDPNDGNSKPSLPAAPDSIFRIFSIVREVNNIRITWTGSGGATNIVQAANGTSTGSYTNNFADIGQPVALVGSGAVAATYLDIGGATNKPSRFYRIRLVP